MNNETKNEKKKILFILPKTSQGGAETQMLYLLKNINKKKFDVYLGLLYPHNEMKKEFLSLEHVKIINFEKKGRQDLSIYLKIARFAQRNRISIIQTFLGNHHSYLPSLISGHSSSFGGIRGTQNSEFSKITKIAEFYFPRLLAKKGKMNLISNSHAAKDLYITKGFPPSKIHVIPNGIDYKYFGSGRKTKIRNEFLLKNKVVLTIVARLSAEKNHAMLLHCMKDLKAEHPEIMLLVVGDGPEKKKLEELSDRLNINKHVIFTGNRRDVRDILAATDVFVFPSKSEGWPNSVGEAMAAGVPVIAFPSGDMPRIIYNNYNGIICQPHYDSLLGEIKKLISDKKLRANLGKSARETTKNNFSMDKMVREYEKLYSLAGHGRREAAARS